MSGRPIWKRQAARKYEDERLRRIRSKQRKLGVRFSFLEWWTMSDVQVQIQVREGVWRTRSGKEVEVRARDLTGIESSEWRWEGKRYGHMVTWRDDGTVHIERRTSNGDLMQFLRPLPEAQAEPAPEPKPVKLCAGIWRTREGHEVEVRERDANGPTQFRWVGVLSGVRESWRDDGTRSLRDEADRRDLVQYVGPLPQQTTTDTLAEIEAQTDGPAEPDGETWKALAIRHEAACQMMQAQRDQLQQQLETMTAERDQLQQQLETMTAERDEVANELRAMTDHCSRQREQLESLSASRDQLAILLSNAQCAHDMTQRQVQQLQAELRQARIELDAEGETPASSCKAIVDAHLVGAQSGKQAAFEAVLRWIGPLVGVESDDAAALLHALPGCLSRLAEQEGVTL